MRTCVLLLGCFSPRLSCSLPRLTVPLPALPDVHLSVHREVHVQPPVRLPLGDRGHIRLRDTPHTLSTPRNAKCTSAHRVTQHARGSPLWFFALLLQGAQRIVCPPRVFVPSGVWDVVPSSLRLWHLLRIPALLLRARCAHLGLQVPHCVFPCVCPRLSIYCLLFLTVAPVIVLGLTVQ